MNINLFALAGISVAIVCFLLAFFILINAKSKLHRLWALFNIVVGIFGLGTFFVGISRTYGQAFFAWKFTLFGVSLIALFFYNVIYEFCNLSNKRSLYFVYVHGILFSVLTVLTNFTFSSLRMAFGQFYYYRAGIGFNVFFLIWIIIVINAFVKLFFYIKEVKGIKLKQANYLFWGMLLGFSGGSTTSLPGWGLNIYPAWHFFICIYIGICTYAIFKYQLMDIRVAITRLSIFVLVYSLVLGIPFGLAIWVDTWLKSIIGENWFWTPMLILLVLATVGPFVYLYLQRRAENILLRTQRQYQQALRDLSKSIVRMRNIEQLFDTITHQVVYSVKVSYAAMYFMDNQDKEFTLKSEYYNHKLSTHPPLPKEISSSDPFIAYLQNAERPLIVEEEKFKLNHSFLNINAGLVVPCITKNGLSSIIFLGDKPNNQLYTEDDILTFDTLAAQASLAIENCQFAQELADKERVARLQDMDVYSYSLAHEIDNPVQIIKTGVGYLQTQLLKELTLPEVIQKDINESLNLILEAARRISGMVQAIRDYGSTVSEDFKPLKIEEVVDSFSNIVNYRFRDKSIIFTKEVGADLGYVRGQKPELIQVLEIFANNSIHAMSQCEVKKAYLKVFQPNPETIRITFTDTGYGIDNKILHLIFSPFTTTKASSEGTGMGLANAKKIIERHKGKIWAESEGKDKGATFIIELPVAKDISQEEFKKEDKGRMIF